MHGIKHPLTGEVYELETDDGERRVHVIAADGRTGVFTLDGRWLSGDVKVADAHLCGWLASDRGENRFRAADA